MTVSRQGDKWRYRFSAGRGVPLTEHGGFDTEEQARAAEADARQGGMPLLEWVPRYERMKMWRTDSYRERVLGALKGFTDRYGNQPIKRIGKRTIESYRDARIAGGSAASTTRQDAAALVDCFRYAVKAGHVTTNPCQDVEWPTVATPQDNPAAYLTAEQLAALREQAGEYGSFYQFAAWSGLRVTELLMLEWPDVRGDYLVVRHGKGRKQRTVPLLGPARDALAEIPAARRGTDPRHCRVFWWCGDRHTVWHRWQKHCRRAGDQLQGHTFHHLRHTFASLACQAGVPMFAVSRAMGHSSLVVTERRYAHLSPEYLGQAFQAMVVKWAPASDPGMTSNPVSGSRQAGGGFDSHTLPPAV